MGAGRGVKAAAGGYILPPFAPRPTPDSIPPRTQ